jgi:hypothetical protein
MRERCLVAIRLSPRARHAIRLSWEPDGELVRSEGIEADEDGSASYSSVARSGPGDAEARVELEVRAFKERALARGFAVTDDTVSEVTRPPA